MVQTTEKQRLARRRNASKGTRNSTKHGLNSTLMPERWGRKAGRIYLERCEDLLELPFIDVKRDLGLVCQVARLESLIGRFWRWLHHHDDVVTDSGDPLPILKILASYENSLRRAYLALGLAPTHQRIISLTQAGVATTLSEVQSADTD